METPFTVWEQTAMRSLGLSDRDDMRSLREELLAVEVDWAKVGQRIMLTPAAVEKLAAYLKAFPHQLAAAGGAIAEAAEPVKTTLVMDAKKIEKTPAPPPSRLLVLPIKVVNPHLIMCRLPETDPNDRRNWLRVRVRNSLNFRPLPYETGEILARLVEADLWEFAGNPKSEKNDVPRCPRWAGRW
jgi:hypothetical protein